MIIKFTKTKNVGYLIAIIFLLVVSFSIAGGAEDHPDGDPLAPEVLEQTVKFRTTFGLNADEDFIRDLYQDERHVQKYGSIFTGEELSQFEERLRRIQVYKDEVGDYVRNEIPEDLFAGVYIDNRRGGIITIGLTELDQEIISEVEKRYAYPENLRFVEQEHTLDALNALQNRINNDWDVLQNQGVAIASTARRIRDNRIEVGLREVTEESIKILEERYNPRMMKIVEDNPQLISSRQSKHRPVVGGLKIRYTTDANYACTSGFSAIEDNVYFLITAEHCAFEEFPKVYQGGSTGNTSNEYYIGSFWGTNTKNVKRADARQIKLESNSDATDGIYNNYPIVAMEGYNEDKQGDFVCASGQKSGEVCGEITCTNYTAEYEDIGKYYEQRLTSFGVQKGDSGGTIFGPVTFQSNKLKGILSGRKGDNEAIYSHIYWVVSDLNLDAVVGAD